MSIRTRKWCNRWIEIHDLRLGIGLAIDDEKLVFATRMVIGRWYERFGSHLTSINARLLFNFDETTRAANLLRNKVIVALDQRESGRRDLGRCARRTVAPAIFLNFGTVFHIRVACSHWICQTAFLEVTSKPGLNSAKWNCLQGSCWRGKSKCGACQPGLACRSASDIQRLPAVRTPLPVGSRPAR
jgi:hypothetical protein